MDEHLNWLMELQQDILKDMENLLPKIQMGRGCSDMKKLIEELSRNSRVLQLYLDRKGGTNYGTTK